MDYEKIASAAIKDMAITDLNHFLVACALVSDLYCPGYNLSQPLSKESNLARTALRYKVDSAKLAAEVRKNISQKADAKQSKRPKTATEHKTYSRKRRR